MGSTETKDKRTTRRSRSMAGDAFVVLAMTLTTVALAIGLYLQFRLAFWLAVVAALSVYVGLLALHVLVRRSERVEHLTAEIQRLEAELSQVATGGQLAGGGKSGGGSKAAPQGTVSAVPGAMPGTTPQQGAMRQQGATPAGMPGVAITGIGTMPPRPTSAPAPQAASNQAPTPSAPPLPAPASQTAASQIPPAAAGLAPPVAGIDMLQETRVPQAAAAPGRGPVPGGPMPAAARSGMSDSAVDAIMNDYWAFRPTQPPRLPEPLPSQPEASAERLAHAAPVEGSPAVPPPVASVTASVLHPPLPTSPSAAAAARDAGPRSAVPPPIPAGQAALPTSPRQSDVEMIGGLIKKMADEINAVEAGRLRNPTGSDRVPPAAIEASVNALRTTADQMRGSATTADQMRGSATTADPLRGSAVAARSEAARPPSKPAEPRRDIASAGQAQTSSPDVSHMDVPRNSVVERMPSAPAAAARHARERPAARTLPPLDGAGDFASMPWPEAAESDAAHARNAPSEPEFMAPASPVQPPPVAHSRLAALAEAITAGRLDVLLDPILGLADQRARHFEVSVRLRDKTGNVLEPPECVPELRESGLLPLLDCARIQRSAQVASRLADRGKPGSLFSAFSGESLGHDQFLSDFADLYSAREGLSAQLVLSFGQADVRAFVGRDWDTIAEMHELGFRFALQSVTDLDFDLEALKAAGFDFVKLDASVFLDGMPASGGVVPAADICRHLAQLGMTLIVGHIDDEAQLARIFGFGVIYGQGQLFGGARPMKSEALAEAGHAAA